MKSYTEASNGDINMTSPLIGSSAAMVRVRDLVRRVGATTLPVLITGPTGAGKEIVARAIHAQSGRRVLAAVNVCAIPETMFEATLFGHVRGAFTGANGDGVGYFAEADAGTLFLDEIGSLSATAQAKLLRVLETKVYRPVGAKADKRSDFRLVSATNDRLQRRVDEGTFRADLVHRLGAFVIDVPPLSSRRDDIPALVQSFLDDNRSRAGVTPTADASAVSALITHEWCGNVRELRSIVDSALILGDGVRLYEANVRAAFELSGFHSHAPAEADAEARELTANLDACKWDTAVVAARLGVHRVTVYRRMQRLGISRRPVH
jgi:DNA-binding NtrC family response regulator